MTVFATRAKPRRNAIAVAEERLWLSYYRRAGHDPSIAAEVLLQLDTDAEAKREHLALYLSCRESLRLHQVRQARNERIGQFVRWLLGGLFLRAPAATRRTLGRGSDLAVACLPETSVEPATVQVKKLTKDPKVRASRAAYKPSSATEAPAAQSSPENMPRAAQAGG